MRSGSRNGLALLAVAVCCGNGTAMAQDFDPSTSIVSRTPPGFSKPPIMVGSFELRPRIEAEVVAIDNVLLSPDGGTSDVTVTVRPSIAVRDRRTDREISLDASVGVVKYLDNTLGGRFQARSRAQARFGLGTPTRPRLELRFQQNDYQGTEFADLLESTVPLRLTSYGATAGIQRDLGEFTLDLDGRYDRSEYRREPSAAPTSIESLFQAIDVMSGRAAVEYSLNPGERAYLQAEINERNYVTDSGVAGVPVDLAADRSSHGFSISAGYERRITEVLLADVRIGFLRQDFVSPALDSVSTFSFEGNLYYSPSELTRIRLFASRRLDENITPAFSGLLRTDVGIGVEHELLRNLLLDFQGRYSRISPNTAPGQANVVSDIDEIRATTSARYLISESFQARFRTEYFRRDSTLSADQARFSFSFEYLF